MIASVLAVAAGLGVVAVIEPPVNPVQTARRGDAQVRAICTRVVDVTFNPRTARGLKIAKVAFRFTYGIDPLDRDLVRERIEVNWDRVVSHSLKALIRRTPTDLKSEDGLDALGRDLCLEIDAAIFADGLGRTEEVLWQQVVVQ